MVGRVVEQGWSLTKAAEAAEVSERTCAKWVGRYRAQGEAGLLDRSSAPHRIPHRTPAERVEVIELLRRLRMTAAEIAECLGMALSTVSAVLKRIGLGKLSRLDPLEPPNRYERRHAGELIHVDVKKLGAHPATAPGIVSHGNRPPAAQPSPRRQTHRGLGVRARLRRRRHPPGLRRGARRRERQHRSRVPAPRDRLLRRPRHHRAARDDRQRLAYRSTIHAVACRALGIRHLRTRPYRPRTNGKAERFIRTMLAGWAYGTIYGTSHERTAALDGWLWTYNHRRPHGALGHKPPIARLNELNNLAGSYS